MTGFCGYSFKGNIVYIVYIASFYDWILWLFLQR